MQGFDIVTQNLDFVFIVNSILLASTAIRIKNMANVDSLLYRSRKILSIIFMVFSAIEFLFFLKLFGVSSTIVNIAMVIASYASFIVIIFLASRRVSRRIVFIIGSVLTLGFVALLIFLGDFFKVFQVFCIVQSVGISLGIFLAIPIMKNRLPQKSKRYFYTLIICVVAFLILRVLQNSELEFIKNSFMFANLSTSSISVVEVLRTISIYLFTMYWEKFLTSYTEKTPKDPRIVNINRTYIFVTFLMLGIAFVANMLMQNSTINGFIELTSHDLEIGVVATNMNEISRLSGEEKDVKTITYKSVETKIKEIISSVEGIHRIYILGVNDKDELFYYINVGHDLVDNDDDDALPGKSYDEVSSELYDAIVSSHVSYAGPMYKDGSSEPIVSLFRLVTRNDGKKAIVAADITAQRIVTSVIAQRSLIFTIVLVLYVLLSFAFDASLRIENVSNEYMLSELRYRSMFEHSSNAILIIANRKIIDANPTCTSVLGYPSKFFIGKGVLAFSAKIQEEKESADKIYETYIASAESGKQVEFDWLFVSNKKSEVYCNVRLIPYSFDNQQYIQMLFRDMSARKMAEDEAQTQLEKLRRLNGLMVGRELKMIELKQRIKSLEEQTDANNRKG